MNSLEDLIRDSMRVHELHAPNASGLLPGVARRERARRRHRRRAAAGGMAAVMAGVLVTGAAVYVGSQPPATEAAPGGEPLPSGAVPDPVYSGFRETGDSAPGPADLVAVTLPDSVPAAHLVPGSETYSREDGHWVKYIELSRPGVDQGGGVVIVTKASVRPPLNPASPSPAATTLTVAGRPATSWVSGADRWVFFTAGQFTVEVYAVDKTVTTAQMVALGDALEGLPK